MSWSRKERKIMVIRLFIFRLALIALLLIISRWTCVSIIHWAQEPVYQEWEIRSMKGHAVNEVFEKYRDMDSLNSPAMKRELDAEIDAIDKLKQVR